MCTAHITVRSRRGNTLRIGYRQEMSKISKQITNKYPAGSQTVVHMDHTGPKLNPWPLQPWPRPCPLLQRRQPVQPRPSLASEVM